VDNRVGSSALSVPLPTAVAAVAALMSLLANDPNSLSSSFSLSSSSDAVGSAM